MTKSEYKKAAIKIKRQKQLFIEQLQKTPIIQLVCERLEIGRTSYYRWRNGDKKFAGDCDKAISEGQYLVNDLAESMLVNAIKDCNLSAIRFWLQNHHADYKNRVELSGTISHACEELTNEQEVLVRQALLNAGLLKEGENHEEEK